MMDLQVGAAFTMAEGASYVSAGFLLLCTAWPGRPFCTCMCEITEWGPFQAKCLPKLEVSLVAGR